MSGGDVAYNLRPNKFVERQLFVELLEILCTGIPRDDFVYVSMGGPQLEDQRLIHQRLGFKNLVSLEAKEVVYDRQLFNLRPSYVDCKMLSVSDFVNNFDDFYNKFHDHKKIIWFDYSSPKKRREQLLEYQTVLKELNDGDILKITMNANPRTLGEQRKGESTLEIEEIRKEALLEQLQNLIPIFLDSRDVTKNRLPIVLSEAIRTVSVDALRTSRDFTAMPLGLFVYQDGPHQMLTVTVRVTKRSEIDIIRRQLDHSGWEFLPPLSKWDEIVRIKVPNLSAKERLHLEEKLFVNSHTETHESLPFRFHENKNISLSILEEYARHYRRYPSYFQVVL